MKKIGSFFGVICSAVALVGLFSMQVLAQSDVSVQATVSETTIYTGERVQLSIEISGDFNNVSRPQLPDFQDGFRLLSNTPSTSRSYQFINGQSSTSYTYSYQLIAQQEGDHQIPPVSITIDDEEHTTDPIDVTVVDRGDADQSSESQEDIFLRLEVSDEQPVSGQQIIADVVLYFQDGLEVNSYQPVPGWKAEGFWKEELENTERPQATSTIVDGVRYRKARLLQFALFPTKSGTLEISPYEIMVSVRSTRNSRRGDPFSSFFGGFSNNQRQVELQSDPVTLNVQPLPVSPDGSYFGAVGSYNISREISTQKATEGESIEITTQISGTGNVPLISKPEYELPQGLEIYEPQETSELSRTDSRVSGKKTFTDVVIARSPGEYTIPEKTLVYYNPDENTYESHTLPALDFTIDPNPDRATASDGNGPMPVSPVTGLASWTAPTTTDLLSNWWFWAGIIIPLCLLGVAYWQKTYSDRMSNDRAFARSQKASETASDRLDQAVELSGQGNIKQAYNMLQKAITGFIGDRMDLPEAGLSNRDYIEALRQQDIDAELIKNIRMLLDKCASISYAPEATHEYLKSHVGRAESTLEKLKKVL